MLAACVNTAAVFQVDLSAISFFPQFILLQVGVSLLSPPALLLHLRLSLSFKISEAPTPPEEPPECSRPLSLTCSID